MANQQVRLSQGNEEKKREEKEKDEVQKNKMKKKKKKKKNKPLQFSCVNYDNNHDGKLLYTLMAAGQQNMRT